MTYLGLRFLRRGGIVALLGLLVILIRVVSMTCKGGRCDPSPEPIPCARPGLSRSAGLLFTEVCTLRNNELQWVVINATSTPYVVPTRFVTPASMNIGELEDSLGTMMAPTLQALYDADATRFALAVTYEYTPDATEIAENEGYAVWATVAARVCKDPARYGFTPSEYGPVCVGR